VYLFPDVRAVLAWALTCSKQGTSTFANAEIGAVVIAAIKDNKPYLTMGVCSTFVKDLSEQQVKNVYCVFLIFKCVLVDVRHVLQMMGKKLLVLKAPKFQAFRI